MYDGFISYSHAADDLLAPRLQSALQRFAKPWWKRRALRVFRDESSLSANPHLWESITSALDESEWFVLLLSPEAAQSEWVGNEITYWVEHKDVSRILPVVTAGEFGWDGDVVGDAVPDALRGVFEAEPRWVDLRFAKGETQLDLKDPRFADAVADLASAMRGVAKDDLAGEEVRQYRRTVRTAWGAGVVLVLSLVAAVWAGFVASANAEAEAEARAEAEEQTRLAEASQEEAEGQRLLAEASAAEALIAAANAEAGRLSAEARVLLPEDPQLAMLLALEALRVVRDDEVRRGVVSLLRDAVEENRLLARFPTPTGPLGWPAPFADQVSGEVQQPEFRATFVNSAVLSPDGGTVYHFNRVTKVLRALPVLGGAPFWESSAPFADGEVIAVSISPDGRTLVVSILGSVGQPASLAVVDAGSGAVERVVFPGACPFVYPIEGGFSPDGRMFFVATGSEWCVGSGRSTEADWALALGVETWDEVARFNESEGGSERMYLLPQAGVGLVSFRNEANRLIGRLIAYPGFETLAEWDFNSPPVIGPSGRSIVAVAEGRFRTGGAGAADSDTDGLVILSDVEGSFLPLDVAWRFQKVITPRTPEGLDLVHVLESVSFSPDGSLLALGSGKRHRFSTGTQDVVLDVQTGSPVLGLGERGDTSGMSWSADGSTLLSVHEGELLVWAIEPDPARLNSAIASQDWAAYALETALVRGFSTRACSTYGIEDCPQTLEAVRARYGDLSP